MSTRAMSAFRSCLSPTLVQDSTCISACVVPQKPHATFSSGGRAAGREGILVEGRGMKEPEQGCHVMGHLDPAIISSGAWQAMAMVEEQDASAARIGKRNRGTSQRFLGDWAERGISSLSLDWRSQGREEHAWVVVGTGIGQADCRHWGRGPS